MFDIIGWYFYSCFLGGCFFFAFCLDLSHCEKLVISKF